jgi:peroxiredoxin
MKRSRLRRWALELGVIGIVYLGITRCQNSGLLETGQPAPGLALQALSGETVSLKQLQGKAVILHFWATWCGACRSEFSMLNDLQSALPKDTVLLTVVADGSNPALAEFTQEHQLTYPILKADDETISQFQVNAFPTTYFIDPGGVIASRSVGMMTRWGVRARAGCAR